MAQMNWTQLQQACLIACSQAQSPYTVVPADFTVWFPQATSFAENELARDLVLLNMRTQETNLVTVAGSRNLSLSSTTPNVITVPEGLARITPAGQTSPALGTRVPFDVASLDVIDQIWPNQATTMAPDAADWIGRYWAMLDDGTIVVAPTPDAAYTVEITGLYRPAPISSTNATTYLSTWYPELLLSKTMVWLSGAIMRNFGAQSDDPRMALSWEARYQGLLPNAINEEKRRRGLAPDIAPATPQAGR